VTEATACCTRKHARGCVRRASDLVLTAYSDNCPTGSVWMATRWMLWDSGRARTSTNSCR